MKRIMFSRRSFIGISSAMVALAALGSRNISIGLAETNGNRVVQDDAKRIRSACRACGKMECGVWVTVQNGRIVRIEGDESAFQSEGNCCTKSQSSLQAAYHPARLRYPMKRTAPKGEDPGWERITWDEALGTIAEKIKEIAEQYGSETLFTMGGTSRVYSMSTYSGLKALLHTPNLNAALQVCKGPRLYAGALTNDMGLFWYEGTGRPRIYLQWGTACEYSNYDSSCRSVVCDALDADHYIVVDPRMTPLSKEADYWLPIRVGTDGALALAWINIVIQNELYDDLFVKRWTNGSILVVEDMEPSGGFVLDMRGGTVMSTRLLKESDIKEGGSHLRFMVWDNLAGKNGNPLYANDDSGHLTYWDNQTHTWEGEIWTVPTTGREIPAPDPRVSPAFLPDPTPFSPAKDPALTGEFDVTLKDGRTVKARPVWDYFVKLCAKYTPEETEKITGVSAEIIRDACLAWATPLDPESGYGNGGIHFQLAPDQIGNAIQTERALTILSAITNNTDVPAGNRGQTRLLGLNASPGGPPANVGLLRGPAGVPPFNSNEKQLGGEIFPVNRWFNYWCDVTALWDSANTGDPYQVKGGICQAADHMSMSNTDWAWEALKKLDFFVVLDLWHTPTAELADILLPVAHWLELDSPRLSQGASGAAGATCLCVNPPGEAKSDPEIILELFEAFGVPWTADPEKPYFTLEEELDNDVGGMRMSWAEYKEEFQKNGWWDVRKISPVWRNYRRWETGQLRQMGNFSTTPTDGFPGFYTPTGLTEIWSTVIEAYGDPGMILPDYIEAPRTPISAPDDFKKYPFNMTTGSRQPVYFHSEHRQLPWCREQWPVPRVEINPEDAAELEIEQGDWVWIENENGRVRQVADLYFGIQKGTINANHGWWYPEIDGPTHGFELSNINVLVYKHDRDPICGASTLRGIPVKIYKATPENSPYGDPVPCGSDGTKIITSGNDPRLKDWAPVYEGRE
jgi:anaerobic selenocysteine-containing dehydrogenase